MNSLEEKVSLRLVDLGLSVPELARLVDMPEWELRALCHANDPRLSELARLGVALRIDPCYFVDRPAAGSFIVTGFGNVQKIKIKKVATYDLATQLSVCQRALDLATELVAAKNETIGLLREQIEQFN